jgi:hypothetical protein
VSVATVQQVAPKISMAFRLEEGHEDFDAVPKIHARIFLEFEPVSENFF